MFITTNINEILPGSSGIYFDTTNDEVEFYKNGIKVENNSNKGIRQILLNNKVSLESQLVETNTIYIVRYDYDLNSSEITIPENCTLKFEGGKIYNGSIVGNETQIISNSDNIMINISVSGTFKNNKVYSSWIHNESDRLTLQNAMNLCNGETNTKLFIDYGTYNIDIIDETGDLDLDDPEDTEEVYKGGLFVRANTDIDFQNATLNVVPTIYGLYALINILEDNVSIKNGRLVGDVGSHLGTKRQNGLGVYVRGAKNVILDNIYSTLFWGDGFNISYIALNTIDGVPCITEGDGKNTAYSDVIMSENVLMRNCVADDNRRQGLSVISVNGLRIYNCKFINTGKTEMDPPGAGIDFEQNWHYKSLITNVIVDGCELGGSKGIVINDKLSMDVTRTINVTIKDCIMTGTSQIRVKNDANLYFTNCIFNTWVQYSDGDVTLDNCIFKSHWHITQANKDQLERNCTININFCKFNLYLFYQDPEVFRVSKVVGVKSLNLVGCIFDVNKIPLPHTNNQIYSLVKESSETLENLDLRLQNCTFQCSDNARNFSSFGWNIWASNAIVGCTINECKKITLYRRITDVENNITNYSLKVRENIIRFKRQTVYKAATESAPEEIPAPYLYCAGNLTHNAANTRDFIITDNIFFFDVNEAPLWETPAGWEPGMPKMSLTMYRNISVGRVISGNGVREEFFIYVGDERSNGDSNFIVASSKNYNDTGFVGQHGIDIQKKLLAFYDGENWLNCMGQKVGLQYGTTTKRPNFLDVNDIGYQFFDTDLGYTITWNGTAWVNSTGAVV